MASKSDSPSPRVPKTRELVEQLLRTVEHIKVRLVGDEVLASTGLVQQVAGHEKILKEISDCLTGVAKQLTQLEQHRLEQLEINAKNDRVVQHVKTLRLYFKAACVVIPAVAAAIAWGVETGFFKKLFS